MKGSLLILVYRLKIFELGCPIDIFFFFLLFDTLISHTIDNEITCSSYGVI